MTMEISFDALSSQLPRRLLLINGQPEGWVTQEEFNQWWDSDFVGMEVGYENIELVDPQVTPIVGAPTSDQRSLSLEHALSHVKKLAEQHELLTDLVQVLMSRLTDPTHLTVSEVAKLRGVTDRTVRNWISRGVFEIEKIPHSRESGIRVEQVFDSWLPSRLLKRGGSR